jgi:hypothetical protein
MPTKKRRFPYALFPYVTLTRDQRTRLSRDTYSLIIYSTCTVDDSVLEFADQHDHSRTRPSAQSESLSAALLFRFSFFAFFAAFSSFFLRLRSAFSSGVSSSSSRLLRFLLLLSSTSMAAPASASASACSADESPVAGMAGAARTSDVEVVGATGSDVSPSALLKSLYSLFHLAGVFSLGRPNFCLY